MPEDLIHLLSGLVAINSINPDLVAGAPGESQMAVQAAAARVLGQTPQIAGVPFWTDAALLASAGIPSVLFGPAGGGAHTAEEWVDLRSVEACAQIYLETARIFCG